MNKMVFGFIVFSASVAFCQTTAKERDSLPSLLEEVHLLRQAIEGMTAASQRVQIALYGLQMQDSAVARAMQRLDSTRNKCSAAEVNRQHTTEEIRRLESSLASGTILESVANEIKGRLPELKSALEVQTAEAQTCQAAEAEASSQLRSDQAKLLDLQDRIAHLDKALEQLVGTGK